MTPLPRPTWRDYFLAFVLTLGGVALVTYATAPFIAGGIPALTDVLRSPR